MIPKQLKDGDFRFVLLGKWDVWKNIKTKQQIEINPSDYKKYKDDDNWKALGKAPFESAWQKNGYKFNDPKLLEHIKQGNNYGVIGGYGSLRMIDCDTKEFAEEMGKLLPPTYCVRTGSGGMHYYIISDYDTNCVFKNEVGEYRASNYQVVGAGSKHPIGKEYTIENEEEIAVISERDLLKILTPYLRETPGTESVGIGKTDDKTRSALEYRRVIALLREGKTKEEIENKMMAYSKWSSSHPKYKENTYNKAAEFVKREPKKYKNKEEEKEFIKYTSLIIDEKEGTITEQVKDDKGVRFCIYNSKTEEIKYVDELEENGIKVKPILDEAIEKNVIKLPSIPEDYIDDETLDKDIISFINKWLDIPKDIMMFALWNIKRSWIYERFHTLNYLRALGDTGLGKSRFLDTLGELHYKPIATSGATTSAPVFRIIDKWRGTLIMDEADFVKSDESQDMIKIINQGYEKGKFVMRCDKDNNNNINFFDPFCPKILATRKFFNDKATESRCITTIMTGTNRKDIPFNLNNSFFKAAQTLRNKLLMWRFKNFFKIDAEKKIDFNFGELEPRLQQIVLSFVNLFSEDINQLELFKEFILNKQDEIIDERRNSFDGIIIGAIYSLYEQSIENISSKDIIEEGQIKNKQGNFVKPNSVSSQLKSLGIKTNKPTKIEGKTKRCLILEEEKLQDLFKRYGYTVTQVTLTTPTPQISNIINNKEKTQQVTLQKSLPIGSNKCNPVTLRKCESCDLETENLVNGLCKLCRVDDQGKSEFKDELNKMEEDINERRKYYE